MKTQTLSVIIVTKNEAHNIVECLKSVHFANEIIIFDCGSTDNTLEIAKKFTPHVYITEDWPGDGPQKIRALNKTTCDWVLCLDADERVSEKLKHEIISKLENPCANGYDIPFISAYCGKYIHFGDWRGESHIRLFNKSTGTITNDVVHCHIDIQGNIGKLANPIYHHPFHKLEHLLHKLNDYSSGIAKSKFSQGKKANLFTIFSHSIWTFIRGYFLKLGFLDGKEGLFLAISNAQGTYYRYLKLMYLWQEEDKV